MSANPSTGLEERAREFAEQIATLLDPQQLATIGKGGRIPSSTLRFNVRQAKKAIEPLVLALLTRIRDETRLEEAKLIRVNWNVDDSIRDFSFWIDRRIDALARAVSKETER